MKDTFRKLFLWALVFAGIILIPQHAFSKETLHINIYGPGQSALNYFISSPQSQKEHNASTSPQLVSELKKAIENNMQFLPFTKEILKKDILGEQKLEDIKGDSIDFKQFELSQVDILLTIGWKERKQGTIEVELRTFDVYEKKLTVGRGYVLGNSEQIPKVANRYCAALMDKITGYSGFFESEIAFVNKNSKTKEICTCTPQGYTLKQITDLNKVCLSPAWSWNGDILAFTYVNDKRHELVLWHRKTNELQHILLPGNTIISPTFSPEGKIVVSVDPRENPDIFFLDSEWELGEPLIQNWSIDISPQLDQEGEKMVFVSSRLGNPHIFLLDLASNQIRRISYKGTYNTSPSISPDGSFIAYSRLTDKGHRIIVYDLRTDQERQVTFGPGNDEDPAWGPDSYFLAFSSSRSGDYKIYLTTRHADEPKLIPTGSGSATSPAWNPYIDH